MSDTAKEHNRKQLEQRISNKVFEALSQVMSMMAPFEPDKAKKVSDIMKQERDRVTPQIMEEIDEHIGTEKEREVLENSPEYQRLLGEIDGFNKGKSNNGEQKE